MREREYRLFCRRRRQGSASTWREQQKLGFRKRNNQNPQPAHTNPTKSVHEERERERGTSSSFFGSWRFSGDGFFVGSVLNPRHWRRTPRTKGENKSEYLRWLHFDLASAYNKTKNPIRFFPLPANKNEKPPAPLHFSIFHYSNKTRYFFSFSLNKWYHIHQEWVGLAC